MIWNGEGSFIRVAPKPPLRRVRISAWRKPNEDGIERPFWLSIPASQWWTFLQTGSSPADVRYMGRPTPQDD